MIFRNLLRYLANNEQLIHKLSESYPMRRAAQLLVSVFYRSKHLAEDHKLHELTPEKFRSFIRSFQNNVRQGIEQAKQDIKKRK